VWRWTVVKEIEVKIYDISPVHVRKILRANGATLKKNVVQRNDLYDNDYTRSRHIKLRLRYEGDRVIMAAKTPKRIVRNHKVQDEFEMSVDGDVAERFLSLLGFKRRFSVTLRREYHSLFGCSVELCKYPDMPAYLEIEGTERDIRKVAALLGYSAVDYSSETPWERYGKKKPLVPKKR
jgi:predicted adenylyl cyclase CyaB